MSFARHPSPINRRTFLKIGSVSAAAAAGWTGAVAEESPTVPPLDTSRHRILGRTGLKVSIVGLGALRTSEPAVMQAAFDRGVNYVDTAHTYMNGNNERIVAQALKGYRDKVYVATKTSAHLNLKSKPEIFACVEESLRRLEVDYVDVLLFHHPPKEVIGWSEPKEALSELKKQGKARFFGVSTHSDEIGVLNALVDDPDKFYDLVLVTYNYKTSQEQKDAIARASKANLGIVAMKTQEGGYQTKELGDISPHQASLKYVLSDQNVHLTIPGMVDLKHVEEDTGVIGMVKLARSDIQILERYSAAIAPYYCHRCGVCEPTCPLGVDIQTTNRALMYAEGYRDLGLARTTYTEIVADRSPMRCTSCAACVARCAHGLDLAERMHTARMLLA
ncbi:MAG: aldo/keto reductase [Candidatus Hydrogenedentes bacterium]|nr:aldo/keto reductase [Candidatus Hydrogenedentota bacterium]